MLHLHHTQGESKYLKTTLRVRTNRDPGFPILWPGTPETTPRNKSQDGGCSC